MSFRPIFLPLVVSVALSTALLACGDDTSGSGGSGAGGTGGGSSQSTGTGTGGGSSDPRTAFCEDQVAWETECNLPADPVTTVDACLAASDTTCVFEGLREGLAEPLGECLHSRPCTQADDTCYYDVGLTDPAEGQEAFLVDCATAHDACAEFPDDFCFITVLEADRYVAMQACLELPCAEIGDCLNDAVIVACPE